MRLTRREFIQASVASAGGAGRRMRDAAGAPVTSAMAVRKAKAAGPAKGDWVSTDLPGLHAVVRDPDLRRRTAAPCACAAIRCRKTNHGYCCPRGHLIPQQTYDPDRIKVPMKRTNPQKGRGVDPEVRADHLGRGARHRRRQDDGAAQEQRGAQARATCAAATRRPRPNCSTARCRRSTAPPTTSRTARSAPRPRRWARGCTQGFFGYRDYDLAKTNCLVVWGCDPLASNRMVPNTIHRFGEILDARHGDRRRPAPVQRPPPRRRSGCRSSRAPTARWPAPSPMCC